MCVYIYIYIYIYHTITHTHTQGLAGGEEVCAGKPHVASERRAAHTCDRHQPRVQAALLAEAGEGGRVTLWGEWGRCGTHTLVLGGGGESCCCCWGCCCGGCGCAYHETLRRGCGGIRSVASRHARIFSTHARISIYMDIIQ